MGVMCNLEIIWIIWDHYNILMFKEWNMKHLWFWHHQFWQIAEQKALPWSGREPANPITVGRTPCPKRGLAPAFCLPSGVIKRGMLENPPFSSMFFQTINKPWFSSQPRLMTLEGSHFRGGLFRKQWSPKEHCIRWFPTALRAGCNLQNGSKMARDSPWGCS